MSSLALYLAKYLIAVPVLAVIYLIYSFRGKKRREFIIFLIAGGILSLLIAKISNHLYSDPRPFIKDGVKPLFYSSRDNGFPSDHTLLASFIGFAVLFYARTLGLILLVIAAVVAWARVYSGVHHFVDVIGSFVITAIATTLVYWSVKKYYRQPHVHNHNRSANTEN